MIARLLTYLFSDLPEQPPWHLLAHCLQYGQPIHFSPFILARTKYHMIPAVIATNIKITKKSSIIKILTEINHFAALRAYSVFIFLLVLIIKPITTATITTTAISPPIAAPTLRAPPVTSVPMV